MGMTMNRAFINNLIGLYLLSTGSRAKLNILGKYQGNIGAVMTFVGATTGS